MKLNHIDNIAQQCDEFMDQVIAYGECMPENMLMAHIEDVCNDYTKHGDDTIDIDYKDMCFTVYTNKNGDWELCENASYYITDITGCVEETIDIELN